MLAASGGQINPNGTHTTSQCICYNILKKIPDLTMALLEIFGILIYAFPEGKEEEDSAKLMYSLQKRPF